MATTEKSIDNGVNVQALLDAREALTATPEGAKPPSPREFQRAIARRTLRRGRAG